MNKKTLSLIFTVVFGLAVLAGCGGGGSDAGSEPAGDVEESSVAAVELTPYEKVTEFDVEGGLDVDAVNEFMGSEGEADGEDTYHWTFDNEDGSQGVIKVSFKDGKAYAIGQEGIFKVVTPLEKAALETIESKMSYDEVKNIIGTDGALVGKELLDSGKVDKVYQWDREGYDVDYFQAHFEDDQVGYRVKNGFTE